MKKGWRHQPFDDFMTCFRYPCFPNALRTNNLIVRVLAQLKAPGKRNLSRDELSRHFFHVQVCRKVFNSVTTPSMHRILGYDTFFWFF